MSSPDYTHVKTYQELVTYCDALKAGSPWLGFDTEFIGERRYVPLLCLVQISSDVGNVLIDSLEVEDLSPLTELLADESILKITHAGENDYHLFYRLFGTLPKNIVDVQVAAGFLGDGYPCSFQKIAQKYAKAKISKSQTVTDWSKRPIRDKQIQYALNDVIYLKQIWEKISRRLESKNRLNWVFEECGKFCRESYYKQDFLGNLLQHKMMYNLNDSQRLFCLRLHIWRENHARDNNLSREKVLSSKIIPIIVKMMDGGKKSLMSDRRVPDYIIKKNWEKLNSLHQAPITGAEKELLSKIQPPPQISEQHNILMDMLNQIFKFICVKNKIAGTLLMPRADFNRMKYEPGFVPESLQSGWRSEILGKDMVHWLRNRDQLSARFEDGELRIGVQMKDVEA